MDKEPFNVLNFDHGKYEFYERPNGSTGMIYRPIGTDISKNPDETIIQQFGIPTISDLDIERSIDNVLSSDEYMKQINDFILEDEKERYVRALLNRLNNIIDYCENRWKVIHDASYDVEDFMGYIVKLAKGDTNE